MAARGPPETPAQRRSGTGSRSPTSTSRCSTARPRPSATWSTTSTRWPTAIIAVLRDRPLSVIRVLRGQDPFMQKNVPKYTPPWVRTVHAVGRDIQAAGVVRALRRPPDAAVVREPARGRVPRDAGQRAELGPADAPGARHRPAGGGRVRARGAAAAHLVRQALADCGPGRRGEDQRREGPACVRAAGPARASRTSPRPPARWPRRAERLDPALATTAFIKEDREGQGVPRLDQGWRRDGRRGLQSRGSGLARRCRSPCRGRTWQRQPGRLHRGRGGRARAPTATRGPT